MVVFHLYFGLKRVDPNEKVGIRNTNFNIYFVRDPLPTLSIDPTLPIGPLGYRFLVVNLTTGTLMYIYDPYFSEVNYGTSIGWNIGRHGVYYLKNPTNSEDIQNMENKNFTSHRKISDFGVIFDKYGFDIVTPEKIRLLFNPSLPIELRRKIAMDSNYSPYDIEDICKESQIQKVDLCNNAFYKQLAKERLTDDPSYLSNSTPEKVMKDLHNVYGVGLSYMWESLTFPIAVRQILTLRRVNLISVLINLITYTPMDNIPEWVYDYILSEFRLDIRKRGLNILLEAYNFLVPKKGDNYKEETDMLWNTIIENLDDELFENGLEWIINNGHYSYLLEKFLKYIPIEQQEAYRVRFRNTSKIIIKTIDDQVRNYDLRVPEQLSFYLNDYMEIPEQDIIGHGLPPPE